MSNPVQEFNNYRSKMNDKLMAENNKIIKRIFNLDTNAFAKGALDEKIKEMVNHNGPVIFDCHVDPNENCFPMIPSGKPHNQMILGPSDKEENKITGKGKSLV